MDNPTEIIIYYCEQKPVGVVFAGTVIWDSGKVGEALLKEASDTIMQIEVTLPWNVAINFCITFCQGISVKRLKEVVETAGKRTSELLQIEKRNLELDLELGDW